MEVSYKVKHRSVKYPRLEFRGLTLQVILPKEMKDAKELLKKREKWIMEKWNVIQQALKEVAATNEFAIFGEQYRVQNQTGRPGIDFVEKTIRMQIRNENHRKLIRQQLKDLLARKLRNIVEEYAGKTRLTPNKIAIRQQKTKWGSCSNRGNISFNLKLVCLPEQIIRYIVLHEILHLKHKKHTALFWEEMAEEFPQYKEMEKNLLKQWFYTEKLFENIVFRKCAR
ncbi:MAG: YgjP-like metallopeptidase domain-containing protein [Thermoproteota archaeon]